jgi:hypothetical protein
MLKKEAENATHDKISRLLGHIPRGPNIIDNARSLAAAPAGMPRTKRVLRPPICEGDSAAIGFGGSARA